MVLYGRRRLGKTCLLRHFCESLPCCYYMADRVGESSARSSLALAMAVALQEPVLESAQFRDWYELFAAFDRLRDPSQRFVLVLDEYQYLCEMQPAFSSFVQKWWDEHWQKQNLMLVLCGSVTSMMHRETLAQSAPLYGRSSGQCLLRPLRFPHLAEFFPGRTSEDLVELYAVAGGVPRYLELCQPFGSATEALDELVLARTGPLYGEARLLLTDELKSPNVCWSILHALGGGCRRISELGSRLGLPANQLTRYISLLRDLFLVERDVPVLERNPGKSKKGIYTIADPFLNLWFGCVYPYESFLEFGGVERVRARLAPLLVRHVAACFETICRGYVRERAMEFGCLRVGRQWGRHYEIDVAGVDAKGRLAVVGECKWSTTQIGLPLLTALREKVAANTLPVAPGCRYLLFSKAGFSQELRDLAADDPSLILVDDLTAAPSTPPEATQRSPRRS